MKTKIRNIGRRGKIGLTILVAVMFIGMASAALIPHIGVIKTTATVDKQAVELSADGIVWRSYNEPIEHTIPDALPSGTYCFKQWIRNNAPIPVDITFTNNDPAGITTTYTVQTTDDNTNWGDNEVVAFPITSGLTLNELFAGDGLSYTYTILDGGNTNGAAPVIAVIDLDDGRHIILFPGWGTRTDTYTLQFSETVAYDSGGNNYVDFSLQPNDFSSWLYGSGPTYGDFEFVKGDTLLIDGTEVVTRIAIQHQAANTGQTDRLDSLTFDGTTYNFAITEGTPFTLQPGEQLLFYICHKFALKISKGTYNLFTIVDATEHI